MFPNSRTRPQEAHQSVSLTSVAATDAGSGQTTPINTSSGRSVFQGRSITSVTPEISGQSTFTGHNTQPQHLYLPTVRQVSREVIGAGNSSSQLLERFRSSQLECELDRARIQLAETQVDAFLIGNQLDDLLKLQSALQQEYDLACKKLKALMEKNQEYEDTITQQKDNEVRLEAELNDVSEKKDRAEQLEEKRRNEKFTLMKRNKRLLTVAKTFIEKIKEMKVKIASNVDLISQIENLLVQQVELEKTIDEIKKRESVHLQEIANFEREREQKENELQEAKEGLAKASDIIIFLSNKIGGIEENRNTEKGGSKEKQGDSESVNEAVANIQAKLDAANEEIKVKEEVYLKDVSALKNRCEKLKNNVDEKMFSLREANKTNQSLRKDIDELGRSKESVEESLKKTQHDLEKTKKEVSRLKKAYSDQKLELDECNKAIKIKEEKYVQDVSKIKNECEKKIKDLQCLKKELSNSKEVSLSLRKKIVKVNYDKESAEKSLESAQLSIDELNAKISVAYLNHKKEVENIELKYKEELLKCQSEHRSDLEKLKNEHSEEIAGVDEEIKKALDKLSHEKDVFYQKKISDIEGKYKELLMKKEEECKESIRQIKIDIKIELNAEYEASLSSLKDEYLMRQYKRERFYISNVVDMKIKENEMERSYREEIDDIERSHLEELKKRDELYVDELLEVSLDKSTTESAYKKKLDEIEKGYQKSLLDKQESFQEINWIHRSRLEKKHQEQIEELEKKYKSRIDRLEQSLLELQVRLEAALQVGSESTAEKTPDYSGGISPEPMEITYNPEPTATQNDQIVSPRFSDVSDGEVDYDTYHDDGGNDPYYDSPQEMAVYQSPSKSPDQDIHGSVTSSSPDMMDSEYHETPPDLDTMSVAEVIVCDQEVSQEELLDPLPELTSEAIFGDLRRENQELIAQIIQNVKFERIMRGAEINNKMSELLEHLRKEGIPLPDLPGLKANTDWNVNHMHYAVFCLTDKIMLNVPCPFLDILDVNSEEYLFVLFSIANRRLQRPVGAHRHPLEKVIPPSVNTIKCAKTCLKAHSDFFVWCNNPDSKDLPSTVIPNIIRILHPNSPEYRSLIACYVLKVMEFPVADKCAERCITSQHRALLCKPMYQLNNGKFPIPWEVKNRLKATSWNIDVAIELLTSEGYKHNAKKPLQTFNALSYARKASSNSDMGAYKAALQDILNCETIKDLSAAFRQDMQRNGKWKLKPIQGTVVGDQEVNPPQFYLSCLYHLGFESMKSECIRKQKDPILRLIDRCDGEDERLKRVIDGILTLKLNSYGITSYNRFMQRLTPFSRLYPDVCKKNNDEIKALRNTMSPIVWKDGSITRADGTSTETSGDFPSTSAAVSTSTAKQSSSEKRGATKRTRKKATLSKKSKAPPRKKRKTMESVNQTV
ncbi:hypothetical protein [Parendozoicomonas sp. Alg238-R29]|uniref:hypothetical protein n=1 Tax=Parendozoicomonas sp. Alg238-R29 TaxID=2993446 RepID=UPI00248E6604|nr:hypothetical protein [Parendozoicomonas sp. Alg238-R29]